MHAHVITPYLRLELRRTLRNPRAMLLTAVIPVMMYVLFSTVPTPDATPVEVRRAVLASMVAYGAIGGALLASGPPLAAERATGWLRQLAATPLPASAAVIAKLAVCLTLAASGSLIVALVGAADGAELPLLTVIELVVAMTLGATAFGMLGLLFGAAVHRPDTAQSATILSYLTLSALGGLWVPPDQFPDWLANVSAVLPSHLLLDVGRAIVNGDRLLLGAVAGLLAWTVALAALARVAWRRGIRTR